MMRAREIQRWLNTLRPEDEVFVDEGGLTLRVKNCAAYIEVGGDPDEATD